MSFFGRRSTPRSGATAVPPRFSRIPKTYAPQAPGSYLPWVERSKTMGLSWAASTAAANWAKEG